MIISGIVLMFYYATLLTTYGFSHSIWIPLLGILPSWVSSAMFVLSFVAALFVIVGGIFTLQRKYWKICLAAGIPSMVFLTLMMVVYVFMGILPIIFICARKREWETLPDKKEVIQLLQKGVQQN